MVKLKFTSIQNNLDPYQEIMYTNSLFSHYYYIKQTSVSNFIIVVTSTLLNL